MNRALAEPKLFTGDVQAPPRRRMTEEEFLAWIRSTTRAEWVDGEVEMMAPANFGHTDLNDWLTMILRGYVRHRDLGVCLSRDFFVRFATQRRLRLPDLLFVSKTRRHLIQPTRLEGAPDLIIEVVSPDSGSRDWRKKYDEYERAGVREYWIVDPLSQRVELYVLVQGKYRQVKERNGKLASRVLPGFYLRTEWLWQDPLPNELQVLRELGVG